MTGVLVAYHGSRDIGQNLCPKEIHGKSSQAGQQIVDIFCLVYNSYKPSV